nr:unnamed protein product [Spirometra erinaceieuropaei]
MLKGGPTVASSSRRCIFAYSLAGDHKVSDPQFSAVRQPKSLLLVSAPTAAPSSLRRQKFYSDGPDTSEASSTVPPPSPTPPSLVDFDLPSCLQKTIRDVQQLPNGKAPGSDAIPADVYEHGGPQLMDHLTALFQEMRHQGEVHQDFKDAKIVQLYKWKGDRQLCDNHRGISLLDIARKVFARILLQRLNNHLEQGLLAESQCAFRHHRGTTDIIFAACQLQEKCQGMRTHLNSTFVDLTKTFDTVNSEGLLEIMQKFGCPERFFQMVKMVRKTK